MTVRSGVVLPGGTAGEQFELALLAERAGWDGVFVWEAGYGVDPWTLLGAIAARTSRVRLGTVLTPLPWRRPWKLASQVATLDQLSGGRATLTVGLGAPEGGLPDTGEVTDRKQRALRLDEGLDLMRTLWSGGRDYRGSFYRYSCARDDLARMARPVQPRIPVWVVGAWPRPKSMRRALRCEGVLPQFDLGRAETAADLAPVRDWLVSQGSAIDVVVQGETQPGDSVTDWVAAGCTWWLETRWEMPHDSAERLNQIRDRVNGGPPES